jgi:hypothetical protein
MWQALAPGDQCATYDRSISRNIKPGLRDNYATTTETVWMPTNDGLSDPKIANLVKEFSEDLER